MARLHGAAGNVKICLKNELKRVPIVGWGMQMFEFLFLKRNIEQDCVHVRGKFRETIKKALFNMVVEYMHSFIQDGFPLWIIIFPEGTTIHTEYVDKSHAFAEKSNRPKLDRVLLPRSTGLRIMMDALKAGKVKPDIYDITMSYSSYSGEVPTYAMEYNRNIDKEIPSMKSLLAGQGPPEVHLHGKRYSFDQVYENVECFLDSRWKEKEQLMNEFIQHKVLSLKKNILFIYCGSPSFPRMIRLACFLQR